MRKITLLICILSFSFGINAKVEKYKNTILLKVDFEMDNQFHQYQIVKSFKNKTTIYHLLFTDEKRKTKSFRISQTQAEQITNQVTRMIWENQYKKPSSSTDSCHKYMELQTELEKTTVCHENIAAVGKAFGFINSLSNMINSTSL